MRVLQSGSANTLRCDWRHFKILFLPPRSLGREFQILGCLGSLADPGWQHTAEPRCVPAASWNWAAAPISLASCYPSFGLPCLLVPVPSCFCVLHWFPHHRLLSWSQQPASPTYHGPLPTEPGNLAPAHPACSSLLQQWLHIVLQNAIPKPFLFLPAINCSNNCLCESGKKEYKVLPSV